MEVSLFSSRVQDRKSGACLGVFEGIPCWTGLAKYRGYPSFSTVPLKNSRQDFGIL